MGAPLCCRRCGSEWRQGRTLVKRRCMSARVKLSRGGCCAPVVGPGVDVGVGAAECIACLCAALIAAPQKRSFARTSAASAARSRLKK